VYVVYSVYMKTKRNRYVYFNLLVKWKTPPLLLCADYYFKVYTQKLNPNRKYPVNIFVGLWLCRVSHIRFYSISLNINCVYYVWWHYVLHNEELHNLYSSPDIIRQVKARRMMWAGHVARVGQKRKVYKVLVGKPEGKRPLVRPSLRWEDGIWMDLGEIGLGVWIGLDWLRIGTSGGLLWVRWWTFGFLRHGISYVVRWHYVLIAPHLIIV
jgi:hypothetical protein